MDSLMFKMVCSCTGSCGRWATRREVCYDSTLACGRQWQLAWSGAAAGVARRAGVVAHAAGSEGLRA
jgi:hypothetical protein